MTNWQPIETAPRDWSSLLLYDPEFEDSDGVSQGYYSMKDGGSDCWVSYYFRGEFNPTHWQPLPNPPTDEFTK